MAPPRNFQFRDAVADVVPPWLSYRPAGPKTPERSTGYRLLYAMAGVIDLMMEVAVEGLRARYPGQGTPTALPLIHRDRGIVRGLQESDESAAGRLVAWLDSWRLAGNSHNMLQQLAPLFRPSTAPLMRVVTNAGVWYSLYPDGTVEQRELGNWNWDGKPELWARLWVIIYCDDTGYPWVAEDVWGVGNWGESGDDGTWGSTATRPEVETILMAIQMWKGGHSLYPYTIVALDPDSFNPDAPEPDGTWGKSYKIVDGVAAKSRLESARYWDGAR